MPHHLSKHSIRIRPRAFCGLKIRPCLAIGIAANEIPNVTLMLTGGIYEMQNLTGLTPKRKKHPLNSLAARFSVWILTPLVLTTGSVVLAAESGPFQATGLKIGEVTDHSAIVWTRLTRNSERNPSTGPDVQIEYETEVGPVKPRERTVKRILFGDGCTVSGLRDAVPGVDGDVRVLWKSEPDATWKETDWTSVNPLADFSHQFTLNGLTAETRYLVRIESRAVGGVAGKIESASFRTAPQAADSRPISFTIATCFGNDDQDSPEGFKIYNAMSRLKSDFFVHAGDILYYDQLAKTAELARYHWQRMYGMPTAIEFHRSTPSYFMKDDHDTLCNDCWPTMKTPFMHELTFRQGQLIFREQVPMGEKTYRTARWGRHLQVWFVEGRDFRSPNNAPDGPSKSIWGTEQKKWFKESVVASDAAVKILISPTPIIGPDRSQKADNHANSGFQHEGQELRDFLGQQKNMFVVCGDRHWQYMSVDPKTGVREYSCGPASDSHAGGWEQSDYRKDMHRFLRVAGGFLNVAISPAENNIAVNVRFYDVDGTVKFENSDLIR